MRRWLRVFGITTVLAVILGIGIGLAPAHADDNPSSWRIDRFQQDVQLSADGTAKVTLELDFNFGSDPGHGPYIYLPKRQRVADPDKWLDLGVDIVSASSPSGANADQQIEEDADAVVLRLGRDRDTYTGTQTYVIVYTLSGLVAQNQAESGMDEFNWNAVGPGWEVPINNVEVSIAGPATIQKGACFWGSEYDVACANEVAGDTATYTQGHLSAYTPMQVVAGFEPGTFAGVTQTFSKRYWIGNMFPLTPYTGGATALISVGGYFLLRRRLQRTMADEVYLGMAPGVTPAPGESARVGLGGKVPPIAVAFNPPKGARPGELGTLLDSKADNVDVTATVLDLAVRGYILIEPTTRVDYRFSRTAKQGENLRSYEKSLMRAMFKYGSPVSTTELRDQKYATMLQDGRKNLYERVVELGWFRARPETARAVMIALAVACAIGGAVIGFFGAFVGWGLVGLSGLIVAVLILMSSGKFTGRTAEGSAVLYQTKGFELYLATAEANQIKFEEGVDIFSRYLPYAVIFGLTDRWVKIFKELDQAGIYHPDTTWYGGADFTLFDFWVFSHVMSDLSKSMDHAMTAASTAGTAGSFGGSGFSGGGGFGGGGGGGW